MINYQEIIEQLDDTRVIQLLEKLKIPYQDRGSFLIMPTVCHHTDDEAAPLKLYYYKNTHIFNCFTECGSMSFFTFLKRYYETRNIEYNWFIDIYQLILGCSYFSEQDANPNAYHSIQSEYELKKERKELPSYPNGLLDMFIKYYPIEWLNDGISRQAMDKYNIRFSPSQNKIIIPHYDVNGRLVGIRGRALNKWEVENVGKYLPIQIENKWYSHPLSLNLYGLNINKQNIINNGIAFIVEAEKSVLQAESFNMPNCCVAICGSKVNKYALDILIRECHPREIVLCLDQEELPGSTDYFNHLYSICKRYNLYCNFSFIYDREKLLKLKDSPTDHGEEIFRQLLSRRVKI